MYSNGTKLWENAFCLLMDGTQQLIRYSLFHANMQALNVQIVWELLQLQHDYNLACALSLLVSGSKPNGICSACHGQDERHLLPWPLIVSTEEKGNCWSLGFCGLQILSAYLWPFELPWGWAEFSCKIVSHWLEEDSSLRPRKICMQIMLRESNWLTLYNTLSNIRVI